MTQQNKLLIRFLSKPHDFRFEELRKLLQGLGYREVKTGKTTGSRVAFCNEGTRHIIRLHKPHAQKTLKRYQLDLIEEELRNRELIK